MSSAELKSCNWNWICRENEVLLHVLSRELGPQLFLSMQNMTPYHRFCSLPLYSSKIVKLKIAPTLLPLYEAVLTK